MASTESTGVQQQKTAKEIQDAKAMPPPPVPVKSVLLEPELNALQDSLKNAVAQTGLVYKYYAKTFKPELRHVQAPQSLTGALGRELEKYDQVCDAMEAHILRAISILQRDLVMEEERLEEEHAALKAKEQEAKTPESMQEEDTSTQPMTQPTTTNNSPISGTHSARRPSAISISSLHRPAFPHKLDLSSVSFRMPTDENAIQSGLGSPVTLAPKSARPTGANDLPDFIFPSGSDSASRPPDVDLTIPDIMPSTSVDLSAGGSSDKPIELDLEDELDVNVAMSKFYGVDPSSSTANHEGSESIFPADMVGGGGSTAGNELKELKDADFFKQLEGLSTLQPGEESKATTSQGATALGNFNSDAANVENNLSNLHDQNFNFDTVIDLTGDDIDLTNLDSADFFSSSNQPNPEVNFSVDFTMGEPSEDAKEGVSNSNS